MNYLKNILSVLLLPLLIICFHALTDNSLPYQLEVLLSYAVFMLAAAYATNRCLPTVGSLPRFKQSVADNNPFTVAFYGFVASITWFFLFVLPHISVTLKFIFISQWLILVFATSTGSIRAKICHPFNLGVAAGMLLVFSLLAIIVLHSPYRMERLIKYWSM